MKKVIFISALAIAAAVSCTKSDIVDTKFNEQIGFTTYLGRDAQTKATVTNKGNLTQFGVYGFYTAIVDYDPTTHTTANLMDKVVVSGSSTTSWTYSPAKYWTNDSDKYTFFAYSPVAVATAEGVAAPVIKYTVDNDLSEQDDVIYSVNNRNVTKASCTEGEGDDATTYVSFEFKHALARLAVKANAKMYRPDGSEITADNQLAEGEEEDNTFTITNISIKGKFCTTGTMDLSTPYTTTDGVTTGGPVWSATPSTTDVTYDLTGTVEQLLSADLYNFSNPDGTPATENYLMMMPTDFSADGAAAILSVTYKVTYAGKTSAPITKTVSVPTKFEQGKAYTINLTLQRDENNAIKFTVESVDDWSLVTPEQNSNIKA